MRLLAATCLSLLLAACGGSDPPTWAMPSQPLPNPPYPYLDAPCSLGAQETAVDQYMAQHYYWADTMRPADAMATSIAAYFDSRLAKPIDRYSYSEPTAAYNQRFSLGTRVGYGYTMVWMDDARTQLRVRSVEPKGPAFEAGLERGHTIVSVDGFGVADIAAGRVPAVDVAGVARSIVVRDAQGVERRIDMVSRLFGLTVVDVPRVFDVTRSDGAPMRVGYLSYHSFAAFASVQLKTAFTVLHGAGVDEMILDLRYNGGGSVFIARDLASMLGGAHTRGSDIFAELRFNARNTASNMLIPFRIPGTLPGTVLERASRVIVITSGGTASASELVINGLKPFMPVTLVGATTYGKPFGSVVQNHCGTTYSAIHFTSANALGRDDYANGFAADCEVADDLSHALGDPAEAKLAAALHVARTGVCPAPARAVPRGRAPREEALGETSPPGMFVE